MAVAAVEDFADDEERDGGGRLEEHEQQPAGKGGEIGHYFM